MDLFSKVLRRIIRQQNLLLLILIGGFTSIIVFSVYHSYKRQLEIFLLEKTNFLSGIVNSTVGLIDGDRYEELLYLEGEGANTDNLAYYFELKQLLSGIQKRNNLKTEVYTLSRLPNHGDDLFLVANSGDSIWFQHIYEAPPDLANQYETGGRLGPYTDKHGKWLSAFTPIVNSENEVVGSLQADISFMEFEKLAKANVINEAVSLSILYGLMLIILVIITRLKVSQIRRLQHTFLQMSDAMDQRNTQLIDAQETIKRRNVELSMMNERLEDGIKERTAQLEKTNEELNTFFYHASHQMKTPVVNILGLVELAKLEEHEAEVLEHLDKIGKLSKRTIRLLDQLNKASYSNLNERNGIKLEQFIHSCAKDHPLRNCVDIKINCDGNEFFTDPYLLQVVFDAVLENAIFFANKADKGKGKVEINCAIDNGRLIASIKDNGDGIPHDQINRVSEMFYIGNPKSKGSGLGLYLAQHTIDKLGGEMRISSVPHQYTKVDIFVPGQYRDAS